MNIAVVAFRESGADFYQPEFTAPGYPFVQVFGVFGGLALLTQMGTIPILGAIAITLGGVGWYVIYGRPRTDRVGALSALLNRNGEDVADSEIEPS